MLFNIYYYLSIIIVPIFAPYNLKNSITKVSCELNTETDDNNR